MGEPAAILVVDDEPTLLQLMSRVLGRAGHRVLTAASGDRALEVFQESELPVRAVVIDLRMRPQGGAATARALLARDPDLGVVVTSGSALDPDTRALLTDCSGEFVRKPFAPEALLGALQAVLADARSDP